MDLHAANNIYFIGIGGIGMSAIARYCARAGKQVKGYDRTASVVTEGLEQEGIEVFHTLDTKHIAGQDLVIYTPAISRENIEYNAAVAGGLPMVKRSAALGLISKAYRTLAVAGTHGKTTTSTMLAHVLRSCGLDCTAFLGGISRNLNSNFVFGQSDLLVAEADEYDRSFMTLNPFRAVITSLDADHLDIYGTAAEMQESYFAFAGQVKPEGTLLVHESLEDAKWGRNCLTYGIDRGDFRAENLRFGTLDTEFDFVAAGLRLDRLRLPMPGYHNVSNMVAALAFALLEGADPQAMRAAVSSFAGIYRRFEVQNHSERLTYIDDYAHHPAELEAAISTARALFPERQLAVIFQPHLYSRTRDFYPGFAQALSRADRCLLMEIYPAREAPIPGIESAMIAREMQGSSVEVVSREMLENRLTALIQPPAVVMSLGAGDIDKEVNRIREWVKETESLGSMK